MSTTHNTHNTPVLVIIGFVLIFGALFAAIGCAITDAPAPAWGLGLDLGGAALGCIIAFIGAVLDT